MSFEEFCLSFHPLSGSLPKRYDTLDLHHAIEAVLAMHPELRQDDLEISRLYPLPNGCPPIFLYESSLGLFQILFDLGGEKNDEMHILMRLAYCNPRSVYLPFCEVGALLMRKFDLQCKCHEDYPEGMKDAPHIIESPEWLLELLIPSMDFNKAFWHADVESMEEAILRPGDAVAKYMVTKLLVRQS